MNGSEQSLWAEAQYHPTCEHGFHRYPNKFMPATLKNMLKSGVLETCPFCRDERFAFIKKAKGVPNE